jgi:hypothetical protein
VDRLKRKRKGDWWEEVVWVRPATCEEGEWNSYVHEMFERKGYTRVDTLRRGLYYTANGDTFTWYEWVPRGKFLDVSLDKLVGFWEIYRQAHEEDTFRDVYNEAGA